MFRIMAREVRVWTNQYTTRQKEVTVPKGLLRTCCELDTRFISRVLHPSAGKIRQKKKTGVKVTDPKYPIMVSLQLPAQMLF